MTLRKDNDKFNQSKRFLRKNIILAIIIVAGAGIAVAVWFFFVSDAYNTINDTNNYLPPDCYSINGKQICPKKTNLPLEYEAV
jgi:hypothetical protein